MSHHHRHHREESNDSESPKKPEALFKPVLPSLSKNDLTYIAILKPFLSPKGQTLIDILMTFANADPGENPLDLPGIIAGLNQKGDNASIKEMAISLLSTMISKNQGAPNPLLNNLMSMLNNQDANGSSNQEN